MLDRVLQTRILLYLVLYFLDTKMFFRKSKPKKSEIVAEVMKSPDPMAYVFNDKNSIKKDDVELTRSFERFVLDPGTLDASDNLVDNPLTKEPDGTTDIADEVKAVCNAVWTTTVKNAWKAKLIADKAS